MSTSEPYDTVESNSSGAIHCNEPVTVLRLSNLVSMMPARPPLYLPLDPPLVVNIDRQGRIGFLQVTVQLMTRDPLVKEAVELHMPVIRNNLLMLLSSKNYEQLMSVEGKQALRQEALNEINRVLETRMVPGRIEDLYFTGFVMQ